MKSIADILCSRLIQGFEETMLVMDKKPRSIEKVLFPKANCFDVVVWGVVWVVKHPGNHQISLRIFCLDSIETTTRMYLDGRTSWWAWCRVVNRSVCWPQRRYLFSTVIHFGSKLLENTNECARMIHKDL